MHSVWAPYGHTTTTTITKQTKSKHLPDGEGLCQGKHNIIILLKPKTDDDDDNNDELNKAQAANRPSQTLTKI